MACHSDNGTQKLYLFYSQFEKPKIVEVRFECLDSCKGKQSSSL